MTEASLKDAQVESAVFRNAEGLSDAERTRLEGQAQRWKFELKTGVARILKALYFPTYALLVVALVGLSFPALRLPDRPQSVAVAAAVNLLTFVPSLVLFRMGRLGMSPTVQCDVGSSEAMELWCAWAGLWPLFMLALYACLVAAVGAGLVFLATHWRWTVLTGAKLPMAYLVLTLVHCLFAIDWVGSNFPDA